MSYSLTTLEGICAALLSDSGNATWSTLVLDQWINLAINDLSIHFPMVVDYEINGLGATHFYDLSPNIKGIISVEYPVGEDPPRFLERKSYSEPEFSYLPGYYDFLKTNSSYSGSPPQLAVSDDLSAIDVVMVRAVSDHSPLLEGSDECTILDRHVQLIPLFVRWKAFSERSSYEMRDPSPLNSIQSSFELNTQRAELAYTSALAKAIEAEGDSAISSWKMDGYDRIY